MVVRVINGCCEGGLEWKGLAGREGGAQSAKLGGSTTSEAWSLGDGE